MIFTEQPRQERQAKTSINHRIKDERVKNYRFEWKNAKILEKRTGEMKLVTFTLNRINPKLYYSKIILDENRPKRLVKVFKSLLGFSACISGRNFYEKAPKGGC